MSAIRLPRGLYDDAGVNHRTVELRALTGAQELDLAGLPPEPGAALVSAFLAGWIERLGGYDAVTEAHTGALARGDRHELALQIRRSIFGDRLFLVVRCANPTCQERSDLTLQLPDLLTAGEAPAPETITVETAAGAYEVRVPTGDDDAAIEATDAERARRSAELWSRLIVAPETSATDWLALPATVRQTIALGLSDNLVGPDLALLGRCAYCAAWLEFEIDPIELLVRDLQVGADRLLAEVHVIATRYHWSEAEILALPRDRRWRYLELIRRAEADRPLLEHR